MQFNVSVQLNTGKICNISSLLSLNIFTLLLFFQGKIEICKIFQPMTPFSKAHKNLKVYFQLQFSNLYLFCKQKSNLHFPTVPWVGLQFVIVVFPDHTHLLFFTYVAKELLW